MNRLKDQRQTQDYSIDDGIGNSKGVQQLVPRFSLPKYCLRMFNDKQELSNNKDLEKGAEKAVLSNKYVEHGADSGPPDGGLKAWSVVLAMGLTMCAALGYVTSWGIFQAYYEEVTLRDENPSDIAWIGSVQTALIFIPGLVVGRLFDIGYFKVPYFLASCFLILCTFLIAECKAYWQFFLVQGLGVGLASGFLFGPTLAIVPHWFSKRRGVAMGLSAIGSSIGGTIFPIAAQNLIPEVGFKWTMRIFGFLLMLLLGMSYLTIDRRLPPVNAKGGLFNWAAFKNGAYTVYCISGATTFLGLYTVLMYMPVSAIQAGISNNFTLYLPAIANATSILGRLLAGYLGDRFGALNVTVPFTIFVAAATTRWPFVISQGEFIGIAMIYGFSYGIYISLVSVPIMAMGSTADIGRRAGMFLSFIGFGALAGPPISGAINSATNGFECVGWYAGGTLMFSACLLLLARYLHLGRWMGKF